MSHPFYHILPVVLYLDIARVMGEAKVEYTKILLLASAPLPRPAVGFRGATPSAPSGLQGSSDGEVLRSLVN